VKGTPLKKTAEFHEHARQCRELAAQVNSAEHKAALIQMAETWEALARDRERVMRRTDKQG
jgi:hypothetical protein